jgi:ABC-type cobalamin/Fe3+-siderophores transport system ATPase subunit
MHRPGDASSFAIRVWRIAVADLIQVRLKNFRAFPEASFDVPPQGLILVTGQNNAGKSALLTALDVISGQVEQEAVRHVNSKEPAHVWARFRLTDQERVALLGDDPKTIGLLEAGAAKWIEWDFAEIHGNRIQAVKVSAAWTEGTEITLGEMRFDGPFSWKLFGPGVMPIAAWPPGRLSEVTSGSGTEPPQALEQALNLSALAPIAPILMNWRQTYFHFRPLRQGSSRRTNLSSAAILQRDGGNLAEVLHHLQSNRPREWREISRLIEEIVPGVGILMLPSEGDQFSIAFSDTDVDDVHHNLKDLGTGVEQLLMTLVVGLTGNARTVVLEEPETALHPAAQRALLSLLQEWSGNGRVFAASTHSSVFLDWANATILSVRRRGLASSVLQVTDEHTNVLSDLGVRPSDVLAAERILILEGITDQQIINIWFPTLIRDPRVSIIDGGGGDSARHAQLWASWLRKIDKIGGRKLLYVRDRDELPVDAIEKLSTSDSVFVLPCRELENLLLDFHAIALVLGEITGSTISPTELEAQGRAVADDLKDVIVMKRVAWGLGVLRYVDHKLRGRLTRQRASKEEFAQTIIKNLPDPVAMRKVIDTEWDRNASDIDATWDTRWRDIVPGADLLDSLWRSHAHRGYNKSIDGASIARRMSSPPAALKEVIAEFMAY